MTDDSSIFWMLFLIIAVAGLLFSRVHVLNDVIESQQKLLEAQTQSVLGMHDHMIAFQDTLNGHAEVIKELAAATNMATQAIYKDVEELDRRAKTHLEKEHHA